MVTGTKTSPRDEWEGTLTKSLLSGGQVRRPQGRARPACLRNTESLQPERRRGSGIRLPGKGQHAVLSRPRHTRGKITATRECEQEMTLFSLRCSGLSQCGKQTVRSRSRCWGKKEKEERRSGKRLPNSPGERAWTRPVARRADAEK